ncbi:MAG: hypothetical protein DWQ02_08285 [Bacteroidetes bacterium]|nr:MAG: hypothetical protein DWQ02_08285 [Bacteroidota bacterium]
MDKLIDQNDYCYYSVYFCPVLCREKEGRRGEELVKLRFRANLPRKSSCKGLLVINNIFWKNSIYVPNLTSNQ